MKRIAYDACSAPISDWKSVMVACLRLVSRERHSAKRLTAKRRNIPKTQMALRSRTRH